MKSLKKYQEETRLLDLENEVFKFAKEYKYEPRVYNATPENAKNFPLVIIKEADNYFLEECLDKEDQQFKISYEIDIYTMNVREGNNLIAKEIITKELVKLVNDVFDEHFGFNRKENLNLPNIDQNVDRQHLRYDAIVNSNKIIYRR